MVTRWFPTDERASAIAVYTSAQFVVWLFTVYLLNTVTWRAVNILVAISILGSVVMYLLYRDPNDHKSVSQEARSYSIGGLVDDRANSD